MYMSVPIGSCGSYDPVITLKPLWGSPGTELSTWSTGSLCCIRAIQRTRIASRLLRSYTAIQRYTALYTIQLYIAIHYTGYTTPLCELPLPPSINLNHQVHNNPGAWRISRHQNCRSGSFHRSGHPLGPCIRPPWEAGFGIQWQCGLRCRHEAYAPMPFVEDVNLYNARTCDNHLQLRSRSRLVSRYRETAKNSDSWLRGPAFDRFRTTRLQRVVYYLISCHTQKR